MCLKGIGYQEFHCPIKKKKGKVLIPERKF